TLLLLKHVAEQTQALPLLVVGAFRESDLDQSHPLTSVLADMRQVEGVERMALAGLAADDVVELMSAAAGHEMDELGPRLAAVIGRTFDTELLARLVKLDEDELIDALDKALEAAVVVESPDRVGRFNFAHALINHTLYEGLSATRRARMHQRVAEALEDLCGD